MHDRDAERRAPLSRRPEPAEQRALDREVQVGVGHHDERVLPAELEARRLQVPAAELADPPADVGRAGEADLVDQVLVERELQPRERLRAVRQHHVERARREPRVQEQLRERVGGRRRVLRRLPDDGVAAQQRRDQVPRRHGDREVPRGDDGRDADGRPEREELLVGHLRGHRLPVQPASFAQEEVAGVDDLLHLAAGLGDRLADLAGQQLRERLQVLLDQASRAVGSRGRGRVRAPPPSPAVPSAPLGRRRRTSTRRPGAPRPRSARGSTGSGPSFVPRGFALRRPGDDRGHGSRHGPDATEPAPGRVSPADFRLAGSRRR